MKDKLLSTIRIISMVVSIILIITTIILIIPLYYDYIGVKLPNNLDFLRGLNPLQILFYLFVASMITYSFYGNEIKRRQVEKWKKDNAGKPRSSKMTRTGKIWFAIMLIAFLYTAYVYLIAERIIVW